MGCGWREYSGKTLSIFSNSYGLDVGASVPAKGANAMLVSALGVTADNHSVSGGMVPDIAVAIYAKSISCDSFSKILFGVNEHWFYAPHATPLYEYAGSAYAAALAYLAIPNGENKVFPVDGTCIETGTWSNTPVYGRGRKSTQNGSTIRKIVSGTAVIVNYIVQDGCVGTFNLNIDGVSYGNFNCFTSYPMITNLGASYGPSSVIVDGLCNGAHSVTITVVSTTGALAAVYVDMIAGVGDGSQAATVLTATIPRMTDASYVSSGSSDAAVIRLNQIYSEAVARLKSLGLNIAVADYYPIDRSLLDGAHLLDEGQRQACFKELQALAV